MSSRSSSLNGNISFKPAALNHGENEWVRLGEVLQQALQKVQALHKEVPLIVRCESLPVVEGRRAELERLFEDLVQTIVSHPPNGGRLFLYVNCREEGKEQIDAALTGGYKRYLIQFHTNITTCAQWKETHSHTLEGCRTILLQHQGSISVNEISSTGCLFSISLLGKI